MNPLLAACVREGKRTVTCIFFKESSFWRWFSKAARTACQPQDGESITNSSLSLCDIIHGQNHLQRNTDTPFANRV